MVERHRTVGTSSFTGLAGKTGYNITYILQYPCESTNQIIRTMRGLFSDSNIDEYFVPENKDQDSKILFCGLFKQLLSTIKMIVCGI